MKRPGYITRCWICFCRIVVPDGADEAWKSDPDAVIAEHIRRKHK